MPLYSSTGVSVESWVAIEPDTAITYEVDRPSNGATLYFGSHHDFVLNLSGPALREVAALSNRAALELEAS
jgi:hypothetical protein